MHPLLDPSRRLVIAHRGAAAEAPENTLPSFLRAVEVGADALELDVHATADGVPVVIHDPGLERTTDREGAVAATKLKALGQADAGARFTPDGGRTFPWRGRGVTIPTLAEVLTATAGVPLIVEVKDVRAAPAVLRALEWQGARDRCIVASFAADALAPFRAGGYHTAATRREVARLLIGSLFGVAPRQPAYQALTVPRKHKGIPVATRALVRAAARVGCATHVWTVDDPARARVLWDRGVAGIITNAPAPIVADREAAG
jgi:glycerophosphoryl diester phosphodiesterase